MSLNVGTAMGYLDLDTKKWESGLNSATRQLAVFNDSTATSGQKMEALGGVMKNVGSGLTKFVTAPLVGIGALSIKTAADFEAGMSQVSALSGVTGSDLKMLEDKAKEMGATTKFSATEASEAMSYMALAGWDANQMAEGLGPSLYLAGAAGMDLALATDIVTDTMSMFGMQANEATKMTDILAYTQANSNTNVQQLGEALKYCGASANAMGYDLESTSALLGTFADQGLKGSSAGTTLNAMFRDMKKNAEKGAIAIGKTKVSIVDANGNYREMTDILADVDKATQGMTMAQRDQALSSIWGTEALKGVNMAFQAGVPSIKEFEEGIRNSDGTAKTMYETMQDNLKGAIDNFKSALEGAAIVIGERLIPMFQGIVQWATDCLTWFNNLDEGTQDFIVALGILVAAIGPLILVGGTLLVMLPNMIAGFKAAKVAVLAFQGATLAVPIAIGLLVAALVGLATGIGGSSNAIAFLQDKFGAFGVFLGGTCELINGLVQLTFGNMIIIIQTAAQAIQAIFKGQFWKLDDIAKEGWAKIENNTAEAMSDIAMETTEGVRLIKTKTESELQGVVEVFDLAMQQLPALTKSNAGQIAQVFTDNMGKLDSESLTILRGTSDSMSVLFEGIREGMDPEAATKKFTANLESMAVSGKYSAETLQADIDKAMKTINSNMLIESEAFKQNATNVFNEFKTIGTQEIGGMASNVAGVLQGMSAETVAQLSSMGGTWSQILNGVATDGSMSASQMKEAIISNFNSMGIDGAQLISQLRTESSTHMKAMADDAGKNSKALEKAVDDGTKGAKDKGSKNLKSLETEAEKTSKGATDKVSKNTQQLAKNTEADTKKAGDSAKKNLDQGAKGVKDAADKMAKDTKTSTSKIATDTDTDFKKATSSIKQESTNMYNGAKLSFTKLAEVAKQAGSDAYNGIRVSFEKMPGIVKSAVSSAASNAASATSQFRSAGQKAGQAWIDGFNSKKSAMASAVASVPKPKSLTMRMEEPVPNMLMSYSRSGISTSIAKSLTSSISSLNVTSEFKTAGERSADAYVEGLSKILSATEAMFKKNEAEWKKGTNVIKKLNDDFAKDLAKIDKEEKEKLTELEKKYQDDKAKIQKSKSKKKKQELLDLEKDYKSKKEKIIKDYDKKELDLQDKHNENLKKKKEDLAKVERDFQNNITKIKEDYQKKVSDLNSKYLAEEQKLNDEYQKVFDSRTKSLMGWTDLFGEVAQKDSVSSDKLMNNLQGQVDTFKVWSNNIDELSSKVGKDLYEELISKGPQAYREIEALNQMSIDQLQEYERLYAEKRRLAEERALRDTTDEKNRIEKQISELKTKYNEEYEKLGKDMAEAVEKQINTIKDKFGTVPANMLQTGKDSISKLIEGLKSMEGQLVSTVNGMLSKVSSSIQSSLSGVSKSIASTASKAIDLGRSPDWINTHRMATSYVVEKTIKPEDRKETKSEPKEEVTKTVNFYNTYNSPKPASIRELKQQDEIQMRRLSMQLDI